MAALIICLLGLGLMPAIGHAEAVPLPLHETVEGPMLTAINEKHAYYVNVTGGHGADPDGNYSYAAEIISPSGTDATVSPINGVNRSGVFVFNVTMPSKAGQMTLRVNASGYSTLGTDLLSREVLIQVVTPIVMSAKVVNQGSVAVTNVPIVFYLDDAQVHSTTFDLAAGASTTVVFNLTSSVSTGQHTVKIVLDPTNQFARFEGGGSVFTKTIVVNPPDYGSTDGLLIILFVMLMIITYLLYKRPKRRKRSS